MNKYGRWFKTSLLHRPCSMKPTSNVWIQRTHTLVHHICVFLSWSASEWSLRKSLSILVTVRGKSSIYRDRDNAGMEMEKENST
jgi:hypothetical protein